MNHLLGEHLAVTRYRARPDGVELSDVDMESGSNLLNSASANFAGNVVGQSFIVPGALGATSDPLVATCLARNSATQVQLSVSATDSVTGSVAVYGSINTAFFNTALADPFVRSRGSLLIPSGMYLVGGDTINVLSNMDIYGMGRSTVIYQADYVNSAFYANGRARVSFRNLSFKSHAFTRSVRSETAAIWVRNCDQVTLENICIDGSASAGAILEDCRTVHIRGGEVQNTNADGFHVPGASEKVVIQGIIGENTGDDTVSVVCYDSSAQGTTVLISGVISRNSRARGVTCIGGRRLNITQCDVYSPGAHGIAVAYESGFSTHTPEKVKISNCRMEDVKAAPGFNALLVIGDATHVIDDVTIEDVTIYDSNQALIEYANHVRVSGLDIREGPYNGMLVKHCNHFRIRDGAFADLDESALALDDVHHFEISECRAHEVQRVGNASTGQFHIVNSSQGIGWNNYAYKTNAGATYGPILVSSCTNVKIGVTVIDSAAGVNDRFQGAVYDKATGQFFLNTSRPVNDLAYDVVAQLGAYFHNGPVQIEGDHALLGSGGAASLKLYGGFAQLKSPSSIEFHINTDGIGTGETLTVWAQVVTRLLALTTAGDLFVRGGLLPSNTSSGHGLYAITGSSPEGLVAAPVGSYCFRDWGSLAVTGADGPLYHKVTGGSSATGWAVINLANEIPPVSGSARRSLRVNNAGTAYGWTKVPLDDPGAIEMLSIAASRFLFHDTGGQVIGKGPADIFALAVEPFYSTIAAGIKPYLAHTHDYVDYLADGSTGDNGDPSHSHSVGNTTATRTSSGASWT